MSDGGRVATPALALVVVVVLLAGAQPPLGAGPAVDAESTAGAGAVGPSPEPDRGARVSVGHLPDVASVRAPEPPVARSGSPDYSLVDPIGRLVGALGDLRLRTPLVGVLVAGEGRPTKPALPNDNRRRVYEQVCSAPGAHIASVVEETGIPRSTVRYHLRVLEDRGIVRGAMVCGRHCYAPSTVDLEAAAAVRDEPVRTVADAIHRHGPTTISDLAEAVERAPSTVSHHAGRLVEVGLVERQRENGRVLLRMPPETRERMESLAMGTSLGDDGRDVSAR